MLPRHSLAHCGSETTGIVAAHADAVFERCADRYSGQFTPMLVDHIDLTTGEPERWAGRTLTNLGRQQHFLRVLDGLAKLGYDRFGTRAQTWIEHAMAVQADAGGLLYWGGHSSYDLNSQQPLVGNHELKCVYPYYQFLHDVDSNATRRFVEAFWQRHVWDWKSLLFNRHGDYGSWDRSMVWEQGVFEARGTLPIVDNTALSFINTGSDLIYAGAELFRLDGDERPLQWALRLLSRYDQVRHPDTGLGGYQFNHREPCRVRASFRGRLGIRADVNETTVLTSGTVQTRGQRSALTFLNLYEQLGDERGREFLEVPLRDIRALLEYSWDKDQGCFHPVLYDGQRLKPTDAEEHDYCPPSKLARVQASGGALLALARAYRLTMAPDLLAAATEVACAMGWQGEGGAVPTPTPDVKVPEAAAAVFALLDLYTATHEGIYLDAAETVGLTLAADSEKAGMLAADPSAAGPASGDNVVALALLHCSAARGGYLGKMPPYYPGVAPWDPKIVIRTVLGHK